MSEAVSPRRRGDRAARWEPVSPGLAILPGSLLLFLGLWMVLDGGPVAFGCACLVVGHVLVLAGAVATGVAWGLGLHDDGPA
jgi:hypothetical protein